VSAASLAGAIILVITFAIAGVAKLRDHDGTRQAAVDFGVPPRVAPAFAVALPIAELAVVAALAVPSLRRAGAVAAAGMLLAFSLATARALRRGVRPNCHCFGQVSDAPVSARTILRNGALLAVAVLVIVIGARPVDWSVIGVGAAACAAVALVVILAVETRLLLDLVRRHGEVLLRLSALEDAAGVAMFDPAPAPSPAPTWSGLPVGTPAPDVALSGLDGTDHRLLDIARQKGRLLLVFSDPGCVPCETLAPTLAARQRDKSQRVPIVFVSAGDPEKVRRFADKHALGDVFVDGAGTAGKLFRYGGTPGALLIDGAQRVASPVAAGAPAVETLLDESASPKPASAFALRDLAGNEVRLADFAGAPVVLVFWDPGCGFCQSMADALRTWERDRTDASPALVLVAAGDRDANAAFGFASPVLLDSDGTATRAYGVAGTPIAVLVDGDGNVASRPLIGAESILAAIGRRQPDSPAVSATASNR
jgi:peroxiredoxin/uncharacterized membrane protein YphA (DoxX/SURF4 family)